MRSITMKAGERFTIGDDAVIEVYRTRDDLVRLNVDAAKKISVVRGTDPESGGDELQNRLSGMIREIVSELSELEPSRGKELLGSFVTELFTSVGEQERREARHQRQAEGIAAAKARGVRFGRQAAPLPEDFDEYHRAFRSGKMSLRRAAEACGMTHTTFHNAVIRREQAQSSTV